MKITLMGPPIPKQRHRTFLRGKFVHTYDPQEEQKKQARENIKKQLLLEKYDDITENDENAPSLQSADFYDVVLTFFMKIPKSLSKPKRTLLLWNQDHYNKPDIDNLAKFVLDVGNGLLWEDDSKISRLRLEKKYASNPKVEITVKPMEKQKLSREEEKILQLVTPDTFCEILDEIISFVQNSTKTDEKITAEVLKKLSKHYKEFVAINKVTLQNVKE